MIIQFGYLPAEFDGTKTHRYQVTIIQIISKTSVEGKVFWFANVMIAGKQFTTVLENIRFGQLEGATCLHYKDRMFCDLSIEVAKEKGLFDLTLEEELKYLGE